MYQELRSRLKFTRELLLSQERTLPYYKLPPSLFTTFIRFIHSLLQTHTPSNTQPNHIDFFSKP
jgi:hypothetical protein